MLNKIATRITQKLISNKSIDEELFEVYVYGFELLISFLLSTTLVLICGIVLNRIPQTIAFLCVFIFLRSFTGGYHARTYFFCSFVTLLTFGVVLIISSLIEVSLIHYLIVFCVGVVLLIIFAPIKHPYKKTSPKQKLKHKIISVVLFSFFVAVGVSLNKTFMAVSCTIFATLIADLVLLFIKNRKEIKNENS